MLVTICRGHTTTTSRWKAGPVRKMLASYNENTCDVVNGKGPGGSGCGAAQRWKQSLITAGCSPPHAHLRVASVLTAVTTSAPLLHCATCSSVEREVIGPEPREGVLYILFYQIRLQERCELWAVNFFFICYRICFLEIVAINKTTDAFCWLQ